MMPLRGSFVVNALLFGPPLTRSLRGSGFRGVLPLIREIISSSASFTPRREFVASYIFLFCHFVCLTFFPGVKNCTETEAGSRVSGMDATKAAAAPDKNVSTFLNSTCAGPKGEPHLWGE
nr:hypothetical protein [Pectobacterium carotovorum]